MNSTTTPTVQTYENEYINISFYGDEIECKVLAIYNNSTCFPGEIAYIRHTFVCHIFIYLY